MAIKIEASRALVMRAAAKYDAGRRCDLEGGMAKVFASESAMQIALDAMRIHRSSGYSTENSVERCFRDAPLMIIGEGTTRFSETSSRVSSSGEAYLRCMRQPRYKKAILAPDYRQMRQGQDRANRL